jgi:hypothetical protein
MTTLATLQRWLDAHMRHDPNHVRMGLDLSAKHPKRGEKKAYDGETRIVPENRDDYRAVRIEHVPGTREEFHVYIIEGKSEDRLTFTRQSLGRKVDEDGLLQVLRDILGDPPGWPRKS